MCATKPEREARWEKEHLVPRAPSFWTGQCMFENVIYVIRYVLFCGAYQCVQNTLRSLMDIILHNL